MINDSRWRGQFSGLNKQVLHYHAMTFKDLLKLGIESLHEYCKLFRFKFIIFLQNISIKCQGQGQSDIVINFMSVDI